MIRLKAHNFLSRIAESVRVIIKPTAVFIFAAAVIIYIVLYFIWLKHSSTELEKILSQARETRHKPDETLRPNENLVIKETDEQNLKFEGYGETQSKPTGSQNTETADDNASVEYTIQVAAFGSYQNAKNIVTLLKIDDRICWVEPESSSGVPQTLYRVFVGRFSTKDAAKQTGDELLRTFPSITGYIIKRYGSAYGER